MPFESAPVNPHFDEGRFVWRDEYRGLYRAVDYDVQFDDEWRYFLERRDGFFNHTGVETRDAYVDDRIRELTGVDGWLRRKRFGPIYPLIARIEDWNGAADRRQTGGVLTLEPKFAIDDFRAKKCLDLGCGAGRWTRVLRALGGAVKSVDTSPHALQSVRRFNDDVECLDLFEILEGRPDLHGAFDFTLCWGVVMCTHDPRLAFANAARTVRPGGKLYAMIYAPTYHLTPFVKESRERFFRECRTPKEKLAFAYAVADDRDNAINLLDMLNTFYNWTVERDTALAWFRNEGFSDVKVLNEHEEHNCAHHIVGTKI